MFNIQEMAISILFAVKMKVIGLYFKPRSKSVEYWNVTSHCHNILDYVSRTISEYELIGGTCFINCCFTQKVMHSCIMFGWYVQSLSFKIWCFVQEKM
jgi:hypothetical protein